MFTVVVGDADNDGNNEVYGCGYDGTCWMYRYNASTALWNIIPLAQASAFPHDTCIGDADSDGRNALYVDGFGLSAISLDNATGLWGMSPVSSGNTSMGAMAIGSGTDDLRQTELYASTYDAHLYQFYIDRTPPPNPAVWSDTHPDHEKWYTSNIVHMLWNDTGFDISGIDGYSILWDNSPGTIPDGIRDLQEMVHEAYSPPLADGIWYFHIRIRDNALNWNASATHFGPIRIDASPPRNLTIIINDGAEFTNSKLVNLTIGASDYSGVGWMTFSNDGGNWSAWERYSTLRTGWDLNDAASGGNDSDGLKTVYTRARDTLGNEISARNASSDSIFLDRVAPRDLNISINGGAPYGNSPDVVLAIDAFDPEPASGISKMRFSNDGVLWGGWTDWNGTAPWSLTAGAGGTNGDGNKTVFFEAQDRALNVAGPVTANIMLDRLAPGYLGLSIDSGAEYTNESIATLSIYASEPDPGSGLSEMALSNNPGYPGAWEPFSSSMSDWSLIKGAGGTDADGPKTVTLGVRDMAGNIGGPVNDTIFLDRVRPDGLSILINGGAGCTTSAAVSLSLAASDADPSSGLWAMQFSGDGVIWSEWVPYAAQASYIIPVPDGPKTVYFRVKDHAGNTADAVNASIMLDSTPPFISNVKVVAITDKSAIITWITDEDADSGVDYGLTTAFGTSKTDPEFASEHSIALTDLAASTTYHFQVHSRDRIGNAPAYAGPFDFATAAAPDTAPPVITGLSVSGITDRLAVVNWTTDEWADSRVDFGLDAKYGFQSVDAKMTLRHSVLLSGLQPLTTYHFRANSSDSSGNSAQTPDRSFTTQASPDIIPPGIRDVKVSGITDRLAVVSWETNEPADGQVDFGTTAAYGKTASRAGLLMHHEVTLTNLAPDTLYHFRVDSKDASGNGPSVSADLTFRTGTAPDIRPPFLSNIRAESIAETSAVILWDSDEPSDSHVDYGLTGSYGLYSAGAASTMRHALRVQGMQNDTTYHFRVRSSDASGNTANGTDVTFTTLKTPSGPDKRPPVISDVTVSGINDTRAVISWRTDEPADGTVEFGTSTILRENRTNALLTMNHSFTLSGLRPGTTYHFRILSRDESGNLATTGGDLRFNTTGTASPSPVPSSAWSSPAAQWPLMALLVVIVALAASAWAYRKRKTTSNNVHPAAAKEEQIEVLEMEPPQPLRHVMCPACGARMAIHEPGPQRIQCPGCGTKGVYRPKG
jgi:phosphodiesterase/alkaline phosphatase D-like protein/ribosomal protein S27E